MAKKPRCLNKRQVLLVHHKQQNTIHDQNNSIFTHRDNGHLQSIAYGNFASIVGSQQCFQR